MIACNPTVVSDLWNSEAEDETTWWPRTLWIDPGLSSGWAVVWFDPYVLLGYGREEVRTEIRRSGRGKAGGSERSEVVCGGRLTGGDGRPLSSVRSVLAWQCGMVRGSDDQQADLLLDLASRLGGRGLSVGIESFVVRQLNASEDFLAPVRLRAILQYQLRLGLINRGDCVSEVDRKKLWSQSPSEAKTTVTDQRLKLWNMYTPGPDHPRDATRHALLHLRKLRIQGRDVVERMYGWEEDWRAPYG